MEEPGNPATKAETQASTEAEQLATVQEAAAEAQASIEEEQSNTAPEAPKRPEGRARDSNTVFVGKKGTMGYVLAVVTQFNNGATEVTIKARGKLISRAVDVAEIVRHRFMPDSKVSEIKIATEELTSEDGSRSKVSSIEIKIQKA